MNEDEQKGEYMKCYLCKNNFGNKKHKILSHTGLVESYHFVCRKCFEEVETGDWEGFSIEE